MNELQTNNQSDIERLGVIMLTLCEAKKNAKAKRHRTASYLIDCAFKCIEDDDCKELFDVIWDFGCMCLCGMKYDKKEFYYHALFKRYAHRVIDGCSVIEQKSNAKHRPDAWVKLNGDIIPVEIKLYDFDNEALKQLKRYIDFYNSKGGIAVGRELKTKLPDNILFVSTKELHGVSGELTYEELYNIDCEYKDIYKNAVEQAQEEIE